MFGLFKKKSDKIETETQSHPAAAMMKAVQIDQYGGPENLVLRDVERPTPGPGQLLVRVHAAGVNPFDCKIRMGWLSAYYPVKMPYVLGNDFAGEVAAVGHSVSQHKVGDKVYGLQPTMQGGCYAEYVVVDAHLARRMPSNASFSDAAALPMVGQTAYYALVTLGEIKPGMRVLVHAGAGGVGAMCIQIAKHFGAHVVATCSTKNVELVRSLGADEVIDYTTTEFWTATRDIDLAVDPIGNETNLRTYEVMKPGGCILVVLRNNKIEMENREALSAKHDVRVKEVAFENEPDLLDRVREIYEQGRINANVKTVLSLAQAQQAHELSGSGHAAGKIIFQIA